jgi:glyoxylase-like metal-dependent hydrolase (beta-lactamase superfamily II)
MPVRSIVVPLAALLTASPLILASQGPNAVEQASGYVQVAEPVVPGVSLIRQARSNFAGVIGNTTVIEQRDGLVLIDAGVSHGSGVRIVEMVRAISPKPVKAVVLTHWHGDHHLGLSAIVAAWPRAEIIAHKNAAADMDTLMRAFPRAPSAEYEATRIKTLGEAMDQLVAKEMAEASTPEDRAGWEAALIGNRALRFADVAGTHLVLPRRTFTDTLTLPDPVAPIELRFLGRANTDGDIVAWLPTQRILVTGDIVVEPVPFMLGVFPTDLQSTLNKIHRIPFAILIPGHGLPQRDHALLNRLSALVQDAIAQVTPLARAGVPVDSVAGRTNFTRHKPLFAGTDPWLGYWFDSYTVQALIESVYNEVRPPAPQP